MKNSCLNLIVFAIFIAGSWTSVAQEPAVVGDPEPVGEILYMQTDIPEVEMPEYPGKRYEALVPATFDLAERARLAVNGLTGQLNPQADMEGYWVVDLLVDPSRMAMQFPGVNARSKFSQILPVCRTVCGSRQNLDREKRIREVLLMSQGPDGLVYMPLTGRPWGKIAGAQPAAGIAEKATQNFMAGLTYDSGWILGAFSLYHLQNPDGPWLEAAEKLAAALKSAVIDEGETAYVFQNSVQPGWEVTKPEKLPIKGAAMAGGQLAAGLAQYHRILGRDPDAAELAGKILLHIKRNGEYVGPNGEFLTDTVNQPSIHFHSHSRLAWVALEVAKTTPNEAQQKELREWAHKIFKYGKTPAAGSVELVGFFPEFSNTESSEYFDRLYGGAVFDAETCEVVDMIMNAILLSQIGHDYWDDADRWLRNQFAENQLTWIDWITDGRIESMQPRKDNIDNRMTDDWPHYTTERVAERSLGAFAGWGAVNDWQCKELPLSIQNCCTGSGARLLYIVWNNMLDFEDGTLRLHLLFNRASKWADIDSHIPYRGQVDIKPKQELDLEVRIPKWVSLDEVGCTVSGKPRRLSFQGRYAKAGQVKRGQDVTFTFPISESTHTFELHGNEYTVVMRGSTVVHIEPPGIYCPTYQRGHYRNDQTMYRKVTRYIPEDHLKW